MSKTTKEWQAVSHAERMLNPQLNKVSHAKNLTGTMPVVVTEDVVENDRIVKKSVEKVIDPVERMSHYKVSDFYLENIIAVGALDSLKECNLNGDTLGVADSVEGAVDSLIGAVDAAENVEQSNN